MDTEKRIFELKQSNRPFVVATVVETNGSVPGKIGFKMIVESEKVIYGTVGGGAIELEAIKESLSRIVNGESGIKEYLLSDKVENNKENITVVPMSCSGKVWIYYEVHGTKPTVYVFGGGHVGQALLYYLAPLNYHLILIDNRAEFANKEKNPNAHEIIHADYIEYAKSFLPKEDSFVICMTVGHKYDYLITKTIFERKLNLKYIGVIASRSKATGLISELKKELGNDLDLLKLHTPIGLDIGGESASEIALSIAAEIQAIRFFKQTSKVPAR